MFPKESNILLMTMPFITPLCPPMGIACLKSYLERHGYRVKTVNAMENLEIRGKCYSYFDFLDKCIPEDNQSNFFNIGLEVLNHHFMAFTNFSDRAKYKELVSMIIYNHFYINLESGQIEKLLEMVEDFYTELKSYLINVVKTTAPGLVGISSLRGALGPTQYAFQVIKKEFPEVITIMGGAVFSQELHLNSPNFKLFLEKTPYIDKFFLGEGEQLFLKYLQGELPDQRVYHLKTIDNELMNLDSLDIPDYSDYHLDDYLYLPLFSSRGCPFRCSFCAETVNWIKYRKKDARKIASEFEYAMKKYKRRLFILTDSLVNPMVDELSEELILKNLPVYWDVFLKVDKAVCKRENTIKWRKAGFYRARLGVESGSQKVLNLIEKKITVEENKAAISSLASAGIKTTVYILIGHPGETEEDFQMSLNLIEELQDDIYEAECNPFRYYYDGQSHSSKWGIGRTLLYPAWAEEMLISQTFIMDCEPNREVIYDRMNRFVAFCKKLGIPNLYSVSDIYRADERWQTLHKNSVPPVLELKKDLNFQIVDKTRENQPVLASPLTNDDVDFCL